MCDSKKKLWILEAQNDTSIQKHKNTNTQKSNKKWCLLDEQKKYKKQYISIQTTLMQYMNIQGAHGGWLKLVKAHTI